MNRSALVALSLSGALALVSAPAFAQHRRGGGEEHRDNAAPRTERRESRPQEQQAQPRQQEQRQEQRAQPRQQEQRQEQRAVPRQEQQRQEQRAVPRRDAREYRGQYSAPRYYAPRYNYNAPRYSGRYYGSRYSGPRFAYTAPLLSSVLRVPPAVQHRLRDLGRLPDHLLRSLLLPVRLLVLDVTSLYRIRRDPWACSPATRSIRRTWAG